MILKSTLHCETQATWENMFFTVPIIKLRMFGGYVSVTGASTEAKTPHYQYLYFVFCTLFFSN